MDTTQNTSTQEAVQGAQENINQVEDFIQSDWMLTTLTAIVIIVITAFLAHFVTRLIKKIIKKDKSDFLPSSSIFINIIRAVIWFIGICAVLALCFDVDISAAIAALGVGGIALSLGLQDTISNLIGGLQVSLLKIIVPGDNIQVGTNSGVVSDITWHHTTIVSLAGEEIIIPNSIINNKTLVHLSPPEQVVVHFVVQSNGEDLTQIAENIKEACTNMLKEDFTLAAKPKVRFVEVTEAGFKGKVTFSIVDKELVAPALDTAVRAIAPFTRTQKED